MINHSGANNLYSPPWGKELKLKRERKGEVTGYDWQSFGFKIFFLEFHVCTIHYNHADLRNKMNVGSGDFVPTFCQFSVISPLIF